MQLELESGTIRPLVLRLTCYTIVSDVAEDVFICATVGPKCNVNQSPFNCFIPLLTYLLTYLQHGVLSCSRYECLLFVARMI